MSIYTQSPRIQDSYLTYHYRFPLNAVEWNRSRLDLVSTGFLSNIILSRVDNNTITIPTIDTMEIKDTTGEFQYRVTTAKGTTPLPVTLTIDNADTFIFARLDVGVSDPSDMITFMTGSNSDLQENDLILAKANYTGTNLIDFDYSYQSNSKSVELLNDLDAFTIQTNIPFDDSITIKGGKLVDRIIPDLNVSIGSGITLPSGDSKYIHFYIDDTTDLIQIEESAEAVSPVKPQVSPNFSCGYLLLGSIQTIIDSSHIDNSKNTYGYIQQGHGSGLDADLLDSAEKEIDPDVVVSDNTIFTTKATKQLITNMLSLVDFQDSVLDFINFNVAEPVIPAIGDRYINTANGNGSTSVGTYFNINWIYEWDGSTWIDTEPNKGFFLYDETTDKQYVFDSNNWVVVGSGASTGIATVIIETDLAWTNFLDTHVNGEINIDGKYIVLKKKATPYVLLDSLATQDNFALYGNGKIECMQGAVISYTTATAKICARDNTSLIVYEQDTNTYKINSDDTKYVSGANTGVVIDISVDDELHIFSKESSVKGKLKVTNEIKNVNETTIEDSLNIFDDLAVNGIHYDVFEFDNAIYVAYAETATHKIRIAKYIKTVDTYGLDTGWGTSGIRDVTASGLNSPSYLRLSMIANHTVITLYEAGNLSQLNSPDIWDSTLTSPTTLDVGGTPVSDLDTDSYKISLNTSTNDLHIVGLSGADVNSLRYYKYLYIGVYGTILSYTGRDNADLTLDIGFVNYNNIFYISYYDDIAGKIALLEDNAGILTSGVHGQLADGEYSSFLYDGTNLLILFSDGTETHYGIVNTGTFNTDAITLNLTNNQHIIDTTVGKIYASLNTNNEYKGASTDLVHVFISDGVASVRSSISINNVEKLWSKNTFTIDTIIFANSITNSNDYFYLVEDGVLNRYNYNIQVTMNNTLPTTLENINLSTDSVNGMYLWLNIETDTTVTNAIGIKNSVNSDIRVSVETIDGTGEFTNIIDDNYKSSNNKVSVNQINYQNSTSIYNSIVNGILDDFNISNTDSNKSFNDCIHCRYIGYDNNEIIDARGNLNE